MWTKPFLWHMTCTFYIVTRVTSYHERRYRQSGQHKRHVKRRRLRKTKLLLMILGCLCLVIAVVIASLAVLWQAPTEKAQWLYVGGGYLVGGLVLLLVRLGLQVYTKRGRE